MFEQDRLQDRINQLFERIEVQLRQVLREKKMREGEGYTVDEALLVPASYWHSAKGCYRALCAASLNIARRTILTPAGTAGRRPAEIILAGLCAARRAASLPAGMPGIIRIDTQALFSPRLVPFCRQSTRQTVACRADVYTPYASR